jgi:nanoRNase/pAp phosphatase (c-di-AMP/oligoRNAs hydrolase)
MMNERLISEIVDRFKVQPGLILLHHNADIDAVGSAIALQSAYPEFSIGVFQNISQLSKTFLKHYPEISIIHEPELNQYKILIILDTSTPSQLGLEQKLPEDIIVIDHHASSDSWDTDLYYCDESKSSCAEIIFELLKHIGSKISSEVALALLVAILGDTGHFKFATHESFEAFAELLKIGDLKAADVFKVLENTDKSDTSQRIAHLKGAQRLRFEQVRKYIIATTILSSYEASMCKQLITLGADVAFVGAQRDEQIRISGRVSAELVKSGLHLGEFFKSLGTELMCEGGGHDGAAGLNGVGDVELTINACTNKMSEILRKM